MTVPLPASGSTSWYSHYTQLDTQGRTAILSLGASTGTDDTSMIQTALTAARTAGGGIVRGQGGQTYVLGATELVIGSNTTLDMTGCTVVKNASLHTRMLKNYATTATSTGTGSVTSGSNVVTTALASTAVVGQTLKLIGAGGTGLGPLVGNISAINTGAGTVTLTTLDGRPCTATATVAGGVATLYTRDRDIRVLRGSWQMGNNLLSGVTFGTLFFRHVDNLLIDIDEITSTVTGRGVGVGSVTGLWLRILRGSTPGVVCQVSGPAARLHIDYMAGTSSDDFLAFTAGDYSDQQETAGDIVGVTIGSIMAVDCQLNVLKFLAGVGWWLDAVRIEGAVLGTTAGYAITIGDDSSNAATTGGTYGDIECGLLMAQTTTYQIGLNSPNARRIRATVRHRPNTGSSQQVVGLGGSSTARIDVLELAGSTEGTTESPVVVNSTTATIGQLVMSDGLVGYRRVPNANAQNVLAARVPIAPFVFGDAWARADAASLGSADSGQTWTVWAGTPGIISKRAYPTVATNTKAAIAGSADGYQEIAVFALGSNEAWLVFRGSDTSNYWRFGYLDNGGGTAVVGLQKIVAGAPTGFSATNISFVSGARLSALCSGTSIKVLIDDVAVATVTDSFNQTQNMVGWQANAITARFGPIYARSLISGS